MTTFKDPVDAVFKALSDPTRRALLDSLRDKAGQTLTELDLGVELSRFGVMRHLRVLEEAKLVVTRKSGRFKHHFLNPVPIQELADRWIAPFNKPLVRFALGLKNSLEGIEPMNPMPDYVLETYIRSTPKALWDALTNPEKTKFYFNDGLIDSTLENGSPFRYIRPGGGLMLDGEVIDVVPEKRLEATFIPGWIPGAEPSRIVYEIEPMGEVVKLTLTHYDVHKAHDGAKGGWQIIFAGLKSYLETGKPLGLRLQSV